MIEIAIDPSIKTECLLHASVSQVTAADACPLIQHCPLVLTAILDFMAAFYTHTVVPCMDGGLGKHERQQRQREERGDCDVVVKYTLLQAHWKPLYFKCCGSRKHDACEAVEDGGGVGKAGRHASECEWREEEGEAQAEHHWQWLRKGEDEGIG